MADQLMVEVRCRGCRRLLAIGPSDFRSYCDVMCAEDYAAVSTEGRDALIEAIEQTHPNVPKNKIAKYFGISRQRVEQIVAYRRITE